MREDNNNRDCDGGWWRLGMGKMLKGGKEGVEEFLFYCCEVCSYQYLIKFLLFQNFSSYTHEIFFVGHHHQSH